MRQRPGAAAIGCLVLVALGVSCGSDEGSSVESSTESSEVVDTSAGVIDTSGASGASGDVADSTAAADDTTVAAADTTVAPDDTPAPSTTPQAEVAPLPPLPDPASALPCDGAAVLCVDSGARGGDGTTAQPFASVSDALSAATPGVTVQVAAGTYAEPVVITGVDGLRLIGGFAAGGDFSVRDSQANETVLEGTTETSVVSITASHNIHVEGFRLTGGGGTTDTYRWYGGGVHIDYESTDVAIVGNRIDSNAVDHTDGPIDPGETVGGGIASYGNDISIIGNVIENNRAGRGSGISSIGIATIQGNTVKGNVSVGDHGGGLYIAGEASILGNHIEGNRVGEVLGYGWGGGMIVFNDRTMVTLQGNVVTGNYAVAAGSGVFIDDGADAILINELYYANECPLDGGTEMLVDSGGETPTVADLVNVTIARTDCPNSGNGAALLVEISEADDPPCEVTVTKSILWGNGGDDLKSLGCNLTMTDSNSEQVFEGEGNISVDPMFVDPASGDFSLDPASPAVGLGATEAASS